MTSRRQIWVLIALMMGGTLHAEGNAELVKAIDLLRARDFEKALSMLEQECPYDLGKALDAAKRGHIGCDIRATAIAEQRNADDAEGFASVYWLAAEGAQKSGKLDIAGALLLLAVERDPNDPYHWHSLGLAYRKTSRPLEGVEAFQEALELDPGEPNTMYWLAGTLIDLNEFQRADQLLDEILRIDPKHARAYVSKGEIQMLRGDCASAIVEFKKAKKKGVPKKYVASRIAECEGKLKKQ